MIKAIIDFLDIENLMYANETIETCVFVCVETHKYVSADHIIGEYAPEGEIRHCPHCLRESKLDHYDLMMSIVLRPNILGILLGYESKYISPLHQDIIKR